MRLAFADYQMPKMDMSENRDVATKVHIRQDSHSAIDEEISTVSLANSQDNDHHAVRHNIPRSYTFCEYRSRSAQHQCRLCDGFRS